MKTTNLILLIDDEPDLLDNLGLTLEMAGHKTITATDGFSALSMLKEHAVDLIISDIVMPDMGGYQLHQQVCKNPTWVNIPFLFLTGCRFFSDAEIRYGQELGIDEYLTKPIRSNELLAAVSRQLQATE